jgi:hypothetical protein
MAQFKSREEYERWKSQRGAGPSETSALQHPPPLPETPPPLPQIEDNDVVQGAALDVPCASSGRKRRGVLLPASLFILGFIVGYSAGQGDAKNELRSAPRRVVQADSLSSSVLRPPDTVSSPWCISALKPSFPTGVKIHGNVYPLNKLSCVSRDVTNFTVTAGRTDMGLGPAFAIEGSLAVGALLPPFKVFDGAHGRKYMLHLQGFLLSPDGRVVWERQGFPQGEAWVSADGGTVRFILIGAYNGAIKGYKALVLAAGDPIFSNSSEIRVVLGIKEVLLD